ncbi:Hypothetical predicted protein [Pelobates cultripes]|uniref:Uncharacterized protein n=1 Tax=Pelobates cultripes TaxID=61616 RepID=A0AAD1SD55_PELCU|nr:Hypothetical predicted protein [Pelobates cultripes]
MPFVYAARVNRRKRRPAAYKPAAALDWSALLGRLEQPGDPEVEDLPTALPTTQVAMDRRSQTPSLETPSGSRDIGTMLQQQRPPAKMAGTAEHDTIQVPKDPILPDLSPERPQTPMGIPDGSAPVTQRDFQHLIGEIKNLLATSIAAIKTDVKAIADRVQSTEQDVSGIKLGLATLQDSVLALQAQQQALSLHYIALNDRTRRNHIKIRGVPDAITSDDLPHYLTSPDPRFNGEDR